MNFKEILTEYLKELDCSLKKSSDKSKLSKSVISRYKNSERTPTKNNK